MTNEPVPLRIAGVPEHFNLPWLLALERRTFVRAGIELRWRTVPEGTGRMCAMLREGEVDLAVLVTEGAVRDILRGNPSRIIASYVDTPLTWGVHVGAGTSLHQVVDLEQVPFAISRFNSGSHLVAASYAHAHGWPVAESRFEVVDDLKGAVQRLAQPSPIAFFWEKYTTKHLVDAGAFRRIDEHRSPWPAFVLVASEAVLQQHPREVQRLLKVLRDHVKGLMEKKAAPEMIAQRYSMDLADAQDWFNGVKWNTDGKVDAVALDKVVASLVRAGMLDTALSAGASARLCAAL